MNVTILQVLFLIVAVLVGYPTAALSEPDNMPVDVPPVPKEESYKIIEGKIGSYPCICLWRQRPDMQWEVVRGYVRNHFTAGRIQFYEMPRAMTHELVHEKSGSILRVRLSIDKTLVNGEPIDAKHRLILVDPNKPYLTINLQDEEFVAVDPRKAFASVHVSEYWKEQVMPQIDPERYEIDKRKVEELTPVPEQPSRIYFSNKACMAFFVISPNGDLLNGVIVKFKSITHSIHKRVTDKPLPTQTMGVWIDYYPDRTLLQGKLIERGTIHAEVSEDTFELLKVTDDEMAELKSAWQSDDLSNTKFFRERIPKILVK